MSARSNLLKLWLLNAALLVALAAWWAGFHRSWTAPAPLQPDYSQVFDGTVMPGRLDAKDYPAITQAPLFEPTRTWPKPPPPPPEKPVEPPAPKEPPPNALDSVRILGIYELAGEGIVIFEGGGKHHRLRVGESYEGWTLNAIDQLNVRFSHADQPARVLELARSKPGDKAAPKETSDPADSSNASNPRLRPQVNASGRRVWSNQ